MTKDLDYSQMVHLDAEDLAETGIKEAYDALLPRLKQFVHNPVMVYEACDPNLPSYSVRSDGQEFVIYSPDLGESEGQSRGRATHAFFKIVNSQLTSSDQKFYAFYGGNDLSGMFLTPSEAEAARASIPHKTDWPYLPTLQSPYYGKHH